MASNFSKAIALAGVLIVSHGEAKSQFWNDIGNALSDVAQTGWNITKAPFESVINAGQAITGNGSVQQVIQPYQQVVSQAGQAVSSTGRVIINPQQDLYSEAQKFASNLGGPAEFIFDVSTFSNRYSNELGFAGTQYVAAVMQGQNPLQIHSLPLAAALRAARERFDSRAVPIPADVKLALRGKIPDETLNRARYAIGSLEITLPNLFNFLNVDLNNADNHAVTVDDIIVFRNDPGSFENSACHWAHEVAHVDQYRRWGFEEFAWKYLNTYPIEQEANRVASNATGFACDNGSSGPFGIAGGSGSRTSGNPHPIPTNMQPQEMFVAQCFFFGNQYPGYYLLTNTSKIIVVGIYNDFRQHIGFATPPMNPNFAWDFATPNVRYAVDGNGNIVGSFPAFDNFGRPVIDMYGRQMMQDKVVGYVQRFS